MTGESYHVPAPIDRRTVVMLYVPTLVPVHSDILPGGRGPMARYRLRFLLQEFDVLGEEVIIGRSPDCHISIEDPLVSRQHARIRVAGEAPTVEDMGSRNGVRVNGRPIKAATPLKDGDRIRLGTQDLVFTVVKTRERGVRATGFMRHCNVCGTAYPEGAQSCPHCGAATAPDEDTMSGIQIDTRGSWTLHLLAEVIEKALSTNKLVDAERLLRKASNEIDTRIAAGDKLDNANMTLVSTYAMRLAQATNGGEWLLWTLHLHEKLNVIPSPTIIDYLEQIDIQAMPDVSRAVSAYASQLLAAAVEMTLTKTELDVLTRLEAYARRSEA